MTTAILALGFVTSTILRAMWALFLIAIDGIDRVANPGTRNRIRAQKKVLAAHRREIDKYNREGK